MRYFFLTPWRFENSSPSQNLFSLYLNRVHKTLPCEHISPRSAPADKKAASQFLLNETNKRRGPGTAIVCLDENGKLLSSRKFADFLESLEAKGFKQAIFCVGGAYGLPAEIGQNRENLTLISLSPMTFPHEMALAMLMEQVYRARTIMGGHPYHHEDASELFQAQRKP
jgi:23S rRNA (pseudouridine1915-N3)-methyltransferase